MNNIDIRDHENKSFIARFLSVPRLQAKTSLALIGLVLASGIASAATCTWIGGSDTWTDSNHDVWSGSAPVANDVVNLTQVAAGNILITYAANNPAFLVGTTRFGNFTLGNTGGGTTTLTMASGTLPFKAGYITRGGRLAIGGGIFEWDGNSLRLQGGGVVEQSGGTMRPYNRNNLDIEDGTYTITSGTLGGWAALHLLANGRLNVLGGTLNFSESNMSSWRGRIVQTGGTMTFQGVQMLDNARYELQGGQFDGSLYVRGNSEFVVTNTGTFSSTTRNLYVGDASGNNATCRFHGGTISCQSLALGRAGGQGQFIQSSGTVSFAKSGVTHQIGDTTGAGIYLLGSAESTASVSFYQTLAINKTGLIRGRGTISGQYTTMIMSGRVIADGFGASNDLSFAFTSTDGLTAAVNETGTNGWFAVNNGRLALTPIGLSTPSYVKSANGTTYNWGDAEYAATIDMVNSAQFVFTGLGTANGVLYGRLWATDRADLGAPPPSKRHFVSVHDFRLSNQTPTHYTLAIRYNHMDFEELRLKENTVALHRFDGSEWVDVTDSLDTDARIVKSQTLSAVGLGSYTKFAVTVKSEPRRTLFIMR